MCKVHAWYSLNGCYIIIIKKKYTKIANWRSYFALNKHEILTSAVLKLHRRYLMPMSFTWPPPVLVCVRATDSPGSIDNEFGHLKKMTSACTCIVLQLPMGVPK